MPLSSEEAAAASTIETAEAQEEDETLTIAEAKRRLALTLGVDAANIRITIEA